MGLLVSVADSKSNRYRCPLRFPLLDSFPPIFYHASGQQKTVAVHSSLSTTSFVTKRLKSLQGVVRRFVGMEQREALFNGLGEIAEAYEEGWASGSDEDDDN